MKPYYYIFYRITKWYETCWEHGIALAGGITFVSGLFMLHIETLCIWLNLFKPNKINIVVILIVLLIINSRLFSNAKYIELEKKWKNESRRNRIVNGCFILLYFITSLLIFCLAIKYN